MPDHLPYQDDHLFNPETHHESSDVPVRPLLWAVIIFVAFSFATHIFLFYLYKAFVKSERKRMDPPQTQVARPATADVPQNQPLLQPFPHEGVPPMRNTPVTDLVDMRAAEEKALGTYGWIDKPRGIVHIPIAQAKLLLVVRLAVRSQVAPVTPPLTTTGGAQP